MNNKNRYLGDNRIKSIDDEFVMIYGISILLISTLLLLT